MTALSSNTCSDEHLVIFRRTTNGRQTVIHDAFARAHDKAIDDTIHESSLPYTEDELKTYVGVEFIRTPVDERVIFQNARYLGSNKIVNGKLGYAYAAHLWLVEFLSVGMMDFKAPLPGILQITCKRWEHACLPDPQTAYSGVCAVVANKQRQIVEIQTNMEASL